MTSPALHPDPDERSGPTLANRLRAFADHYRRLRRLTGMYRTEDLSHTELLYEAAEALKDVELIQPIGPEDPEPAVGAVIEIHHGVRPTQIWQHRRPRTCEDGWVVTGDKGLWPYAQVQAMMRAVDVDRVTVRTDPS